jgi:hypothetical protein
MAHSRGLGNGSPVSVCLRGEDAEDNPLPLVKEINLSDRGNVPPLLRERNPSDRGNLPLPLRERNPSDRDNPLLVKEINPSDWGNLPLLVREISLSDQDNLPFQRLKDYKDRSPNRSDRLFDHLERPERQKLLLRDLVKELHRRELCGQGVVIQAVMSGNSGMCWRLNR